MNDKAWRGGWGGAMHMMIYLDVENSIFWMKTSLWRESTLIQRPAMRPSMLYHEISTYFTSYLSDINKIMFISHVGALDGHVERNTKNHRFLEFQLIF